MKIIIYFIIISIILYYQSNQYLKNGYTYSYNKFRSLYVHSNNSKRITNFIFRMASFPINNLPNEIKDVLDHCNKKNPNYIQIYLDDNDCILFIKEYYPEYYTAYMSVIPGAFRSDIVRLLLLYKYGGIYADIGYQFVQPIDFFINDTDEMIIIKDVDKLKEKNKKLTNVIVDIITNSYSIHNAFIATYPSHFLIYEMIKYIMSNVNKKYYGKTALDITGPNALGVVYKNIFNRPLEIGTFNINNNKIKILYYNFGNNYVSIIDENNYNLMITKFKNYHKVMYSKIPHYKKLWANKLVYK